MEIELIELIRAIFGDNAVYIIATLSIVGYAWTQVRQLIPARVIAQLPAPLVWILEVAAGNRMNAGNALYNDPDHHKRVKSGKL